MKPLLIPDDWVQVFEMICAANVDESITSDSNSGAYWYVGHDDGVSRYKVRFVVVEDKVGFVYAW
jgi:hypothetical protein